MDTLSAIAASGLRARMESLDLLANNVANASTAGYKADREFYSLYLAPESSSGGATMPLIERPWLDMSQGSVRVTGNPLDLALLEEGFFSVESPGGPLYTRNGSFRLGAGGALVDAEGRAVLGVDGAGIRLDPAQAIDISPDGTIWQNGSAAGQIAIIGFADTAGLSKQGDNYLRIADRSISSPAPAQAAVAQGQLEDSNTGNAEAAVRLVSVMRHFEMLQRAVSMAGEMNRQAIQEVAKVG